MLKLGGYTYYHALHFHLLHQHFSARLLSPTLLLVAIVVAVVVDLVAQTSSSCGSITSLHHALHYIDIFVTLQKYLQLSASCRNFSFQFQFVFKGLHAIKHTVVERGDVHANA